MDSRPDEAAILKCLYDVTEDLAVELISQFSLDELKYLTKSIERLVKAKSVLEACRSDIPYPLLELLRNYDKSVGANLNS